MASIEEGMMAELVAGLQLNPAAAAAMLDEVQVGSGRFWPAWQSYSLFEAPCLGGGVGCCKHTTEGCCALNPALHCAYPPAP